MRISSLGEFGLIERIADRVPPYGEDVVVGIGDDVAVLHLGDDRYQLASCDVQVEGVHFTRRETTPEQLGRKAAAIACAGRHRRARRLLDKRTSHVQSGTYFSGMRC